LFNTLAHYYPPREELESQALKELGFDVSPKSISYGLYLAIRICTKRMRAAPSRPSREEQTKLYAGFLPHYSERNGNQCYDGQVMQCWPDVQLNASMKSCFLTMSLRRSTLKAQGLKLALLTNLQTEVNTMCRELGIGEYLDFTVTSAESGRRQAQPRFFLKKL